MTTVEHGRRSQHLPLPRAQRQGVALCLSGGGYRAALFHLGATRRLNELGVLSKVDTFTSVSGGSIFASLIAAYAVRDPDAWSQPGRTLPDYDAQVAEPMQELAQHNIRTRTVLSRLLPWNWRDSQVQIDALTTRLADGPTGDARLGDLPERPRFIFCSSEMQFRAQWTFDSGGRMLGADPCGHAAFGDTWTIARAAASSSCLPGAFAPMRVTDSLTGGTYDDDDVEELKRTLALSDGGMYDNLGVEPVWRDHAAVLVSDAGPSFRPNPGLGRVWNSLRFAIILLEQATDVRKRWLLSNLAAGAGVLRPLRTPLDRADPHRPRRLLRGRARGAREPRLRHRRRRGALARPRAGGGVARAARALPGLDGRGASRGGPGRERQDAGLRARVVPPLTTLRVWVRRTTIRAHGRGLRTSWSTVPR